jgi:hypothetical protein
MSFLGACSQHFSHFKNRNAVIWRSLFIGGTVLIVFCLLFYLAEKCLESKWQNPGRFVPERHEILPSLALSNSIFIHSNLNSKIRIIPDEADFSKMIGAVGDIIGMRLFTGIYGNPVMASGAELYLVLQTGGLRCVRTNSFRLQENAWTTIFFDSCKLVPFLEINGFKDTSSVIITGSESSKFAIYATENGAAAFQLAVPKIYGELDHPNITSSEAQNYASIWRGSSFYNLNLIIKLLLSIALTALFFTLVSQRVKMTPRKVATLTSVALFIAWFFLGLQHALFSPPFQDPDEPALLIGLVVETSSTPDQVVASLTSLAGPAQFNCVKARSDRGIIPGQICGDGFGSDFIIAGPSNRGALYKFISRPLYLVSEMAWRNYADYFSRYIGTYVRLANLIFNAAIILVVILSHLYFSRYFSAVAIFTVLLVPAFIPIVSGVTNYGSCFVLGAAFFSFLMPDGNFSNRQKCLVLAPFFGVSACLYASSQLSLFVLLPLLIAFGTIQGNPRGIMKSRVGFYLPFLSLLFALLIARFFLGYDWLTRADRLDQKLSQLHVTKGQLLSLMRSFGVGWVHLIFLVSLCLSLLVVSLRHKYLPKLNWMSKAPLLRQINTSLFLGFVLCVAVYSVKLSSSPSYLISLTSNPRPPFFDFLKMAIKAVISQAFNLPQDFFLIQTYFMAYGWLDTTAPNLLYFVLRHVISFAWLWLIFKWFTRLGSGRFFPIGALFFWVIYWLAGFYGAWSEGHTLVARYVSPGVALPIFALTYGLFYQRRSILMLINIALIISCIYGQFYLEPIRFLIGIG